MNLSDKQPAFLQILASQDLKIALRFGPTKAEVGL